TMPRRPRVASPSTRSIHRRWNQDDARVCIWWVRCWTWTAGLAALTFNGPGQALELPHELWPSHQFEFTRSFPSLSAYAFLPRRVPDNPAARYVLCTDTLRPPVAPAALR